MFFRFSCNLNIWLFFFKYTSVCFCEPNQQSTKCKFKSARIPILSHSKHTTVYMDVLNVLSVFFILRYIFPFNSQCNVCQCHITFPSGSGTVVSNMDDIFASAFSYYLYCFCLWLLNSQAVYTSRTHYARRREH